MKHLYFLLFLNAIVSFGQQSWDDLNGKERAYLYHITRKTEILKPELFHLFEFTDSIPYINDTLPDYGYIEKQIVKSPEKLIFHSDQVSRKSNGLVQDLTVKFALWELGSVLHYRNSTDEKDKALKIKLKEFEKYVLEEVPQIAVRTLGNGDYVLLESLQGYYNPSLSVVDKLAAIKNAGYSDLDQMLIINAIMAAQEKYVNNRSIELFQLLGGESDEEDMNFLSAVGDGSNWSDLVGGFNTPYDVGLPDEKGLYRFQIEQYLDKETDREVVKTKEVEVREMRTDPSKQTVLHFDVAAYHEERQTTIAIQKGGNSYVLYGNNENRLLSPDSTYGEGTTYWRLMYNLEFEHIAYLNEMLYGKRGYKYQIELTEKQIETIKLLIKKSEYKLDKLRHTPEGKPKIKKKKIKKKNLGFSDQDGGGHPTSALSKNDKKKMIERNRLLRLNGDLEAKKSHLKKLKKEMEEAYFVLVRYETKLDKMKKNLGYIIMEFEEDNYIYTFKDGASFNYLTQDFTFPADKNQEAFRIYHIAFGEEVFSDKIEESFVHIHHAKSEVKNKFVLDVVQRDAAPKVLSKGDSIEVLELFNYLLRDEGKPTLVVNAGGILQETDEGFFRDAAETPIKYDPENPISKGLVHFHANHTNYVEIIATVYDDKMIPLEFEKYQSFFERFKLKNPNLNEVDFYTGIRAKHETEKWLLELNRYADLWIKSEADKKVILKKIKKLKVKKVQFNDGKVEAKIPDFIE